MFTHVKLYENSYSLYSYYSIHDVEKNYIHSDSEYKNEKEIYIRTVNIYDIMYHYYYY